MASPVEAEDSGSEDAVLSSEVASEEEEDSAEVLLVFPPTMVLAEVQPASAEFSEFHLILPLCTL